MIIKKEEYVIFQSKPLKVLFLVLNLVRIPSVSVAKSYGHR